MHREVIGTASPDKLSQAFEHSITWEDDIWRADPVDVAEVHIKARRKFTELLSDVTSGRGATAHSRILLFHGQSGAGDLNVRVHVWTPTQLSAEQRRILEELAKVEGEPPKESGGFWSRLKEALGA